MTATEELRRLLDERGVEYRFSGCTKVFDWHFNGVNGEGDACATEVQGGINILARGITPEQAIAATLGAGTCKEVYLLMATDIGDGREEVLGVYATEEAAMAAINENQFGYAFHQVRKQEVVE